MDDVLVDEGDGVNIAARLQSLAEVGGICISRSVRDQVRDRLPVTLEDLGEQSVRNIDRPVRCYRVRLDAYTAGAAPAAAGGRRGLLPAAAAIGLNLLDSARKCRAPPVQGAAASGAEAK